jgi:hypothetical protein
MTDQEGAAEVGGPLDALACSRPAAVDCGSQPRHDGVADGVVHRVREGRPGQLAGASSWEFLSSETATNGEPTGDVAVNHRCQTRRPGPPPQRARASGCRPARSYAGDPTAWRERAEAGDLARSAHPRPAPGHDAVARLPQSPFAPGVESATHISRPDPHRHLDGSALVGPLPAAAVGQGAQHEHAGFGGDVEYHRELVRPVRAELSRCLVGACSRSGGRHLH